MTRDSFEPEARVAHGSDGSVVVRQVPTGMRISIDGRAVVISIEDWETLIDQETIEKRGAYDFAEWLEIYGKLDPSVGSDVAQEYLREILCH